MSQAILLLTRPKAQSLRVLRDVEAAMGAEVAHLIAPIMTIVPRDAGVRIADYAGVILTSVNGVAAAPDLTGRVVHCVGERTAEAARDRGAEVRVVAMDAARLIERLLEAGVAGPLLHLRGEHARGDVARTLSSTGVETHEAVIYAQEAEALTPDTVRLIEGEGALVLPLYSPRSAELVGQAARPGSRVHAIALSQAVADAFAAKTGLAAEICAEPTGGEVIARIAAALHAEKT